MITIASEAIQTAADEQATQPAAPGLTPEEHLERERHAKVAEHAYGLAMARGFTPGYELDDWLSAERALAGNAGAQAD